MLIGIYGLIGSGKTTVAAKISAMLNAENINLDDVAKIIINREDVLEKIASFDPKVINNNVIDRNLFREKIFTNPDYANTINSITWPAINDYVESMIKPGLGYVIEGAILPKISLYERLDHKILITTPNTEINLERVLKRDGKDKHQTQGIIDQQLKLLAGAVPTSEIDSTKGFIKQITTIFK
ncbi:dephospho-CoA kinase [[Acholeplasma] multilocale]|uniref:dephospho-CoA kinase n=1 Tax=[Acholeplasma] multilocale TaxID=264638 RepID=UPI00047D381B|nr:dephospho-CoA kinase [[Acholeplasma] multilocale]